jgi:hypothetical protein
LSGFNSGEQAFQTVQPRLLRLVFRIQNLPQVFDAIGNVSGVFPAGLVLTMLIA